MLTVISPEYTEAAQTILRRVPMLSLIFKEAEADRVEYIIQAGNSRQLRSLSDSRNVKGGAYPAYPTGGLNQLVQQSKIAQSLASILGETTNVNFTIAQSFRAMPENSSTAIAFAVGSIVGSILYPFAVSFLLPIYVITLVREKEERILIMMKMNGLKQWVYIMTEYIHFYILHILTSFVFIITGVICQLEFFTQTDPGVYILLLFVWGHVQVAMAFFLATFFNKARTALVSVFLLVLAGVIINVAISSLFPDDSTPIAYFIYPPFAFYRSLIVINAAAYSTSTPAYTMSLVIPGNDVFNALWFMVWEYAVLVLATFYLVNVLPSEFGVRRPWHFPVSVTYKAIRRRLGYEPENDFGSKSTDLTLDGEDDDVRAERDRVFRNEYPSDAPVVLKDMRKVFPQKTAVKGASFALESNLVFGLLGPNGAGKTTLINILTGLYESSSGAAFLAGHRVGLDMRNVYMNIGVCPQHDILWGDLTVEEHLLFYARLKGIPPAEEPATVDEALETVGLQKFRTRLSKGLSGGEKRRLSIAIAVIGRGKVIFLDEPTVRTTHIYTFAVF